MRLKNPKMWAFFNISPRESRIVCINWKIHIEASAQERHRRLSSTAKPASGFGAKESHSRSLSTRDTISTCGAPWECARKISSARRHVHTYSKPFVGQGFDVDAPATRLEQGPKTLDSHSLSTLK